jgi:hypothetical protein
MTTVTNPRYRFFRQSHYTAGDKEQFLDAWTRPPPDWGRDKNILPEDASLSFGHEIDPRFRNPDPVSVMNTFEYLFDKMKKGIFVRIRDNRVDIFLPFSKAYYKNNYPIKMCPIDVFRSIQQREGRPFDERKIQKQTAYWYANNGIFRYENPIRENESGIHELHDMFVETCRHRKIPDVEFFLNKRDFPLLKRDYTEPYDAIYGDRHPLEEAYRHDRHCPILGMTTREGFSDVPIPTWDDWARVSSIEDGKHFPRDFRDYREDMHTDWDSKIPTLVFRGASTGLGTTIEDNPRLFMADLSLLGLRDPEDGVLWMDCGITKWNLRARKNSPDRPLDTIRVTHIPLVGYKTMSEQSRYKYVLHLPGHSFAYRLSCYMGMGSVILMWECPYEIWYSRWLKPFVHYVPIEKEYDKDEILGKLRWCKTHDEECRRIAQNAREFYDRYLDKNGIMNYLQTLLIDLRPGSYPHTDHRQIQMMMKRGFYVRPIVDIIQDQRIPIQKNVDRCGSVVIKKCRDEGHFYHEWLFASKVSGEDGMMRMSFHDPDRLEIGYEFIDGVTLKQWIEGSSFCLREFSEVILVRILIVLRRMRIRLGMIHYDLYPWNVLVKDGRPFLIDYGRTYYVHEGNMMIHVEPFYLYGFHDVLSIVCSSVSLILEHHRLSVVDQKEVIRWFEYLCPGLNNLFLVKNYATHQKKMDVMLSRRGRDERTIGGFFEHLTRRPVPLSMPPPRNKKYTRKQLERLITGSTIMTVYHLMRAYEDTEAYDEILMRWNQNYPELVRIVPYPTRQHIPSCLRHTGPCEEITLPAFPDDFLWVLSMTNHPHYEKIFRHKIEAWKCLNPFEEFAIYAYQSSHQRSWYKTYSASGRSRCSDPSGS